MKDAVPTNIALIGYRGTGKSAVAKILAQKTGKTAVSLDAEIVNEAGTSIPQLVEAFGWDYFRDLEQKLTARFASGKNLIIDCGGGVILRSENVAALQANAQLVWLTASPDVIESRISSSTERPPLVEGKTFLEEIEEVLTARIPLYRAAANVSIDTNTLSPEEIADAVLTQLRVLSEK